MGRIVEGTWNCKYCGTSGIKGRFRECPNCGRPRDKDTTFELPQKIEYVLDEVANNINKNPDWVCPYCDSLNSDSDTTCKSCGTPRDSKNLDYFQNKEKKSITSSNHSTYNYDDKDDRSSEYNYNFGSNTSSSFDSSLSSSYKSYSEKNFLKEFFSNYWKPFTAISVALIFIIGLIYILIPKEQTITIENFRWIRSIEIERYQTVNESDWNLPSNARLHYTKNEIYDYVPVLDHYELRTRQVPHERLIGYETVVTGYKDLGNGYFEEQTDMRPVYETYYETEYYDEAIYRDDPIYKTKYYYEIDKWLYERSVKTSEKSHYPYWGETNLNSDERVSAKNETYYISYLDKKEKIKELKISYDEWKTLSINQNIKVKISALGTCELIE